jgi:hypothetical protein
MAGMSSRVMLLSIPSLGMHRVTGISSKLRSCIPFQPCHAQRAFNSGMCVCVCVCVWPSLPHVVCVQYFLGLTGDRVFLFCGN